MSQLKWLENLSSHCYVNISMNTVDRHWSFWTAGQQEYPFFTTNNVFWCVCLSQVCVLLCGLQWKWKSAKRHVIKAGCPSLWLTVAALDYSFTWLDVSLEIFGWKGHLACHRINVRRRRQYLHAIWDCLSYWWVFE